MVDDFNEDDLVVARALMEAMKYERAKIDSIMSFLHISYDIKDFDAVGLVLGHIGDDFMKRENLFQ